MTRQDFEKNPQNEGKKNFLSQLERSNLMAQDQYHTNMGPEPLLRKFSSVDQLAAEYDQMLQLQATACEQ